MAIHVTNKQQPYKNFLEMSVSLKNLVLFFFISQKKHHAKQDWNQLKEQMELVIENQPTEDIN